MGRFSALTLLTLLIGCSHLPVSGTSCTPGMGMTCVLKSLNTMTDGFDTLRNIPPNTYFSVRVNMLSMPNNPSGTFLTRVSEFVNKLELSVFRDATFLIPPGVFLSSIQVLTALPMKQLIIGVGDNNVTELLFYTCGLEQVSPTIGNLPLLEELTLSGCAVRNFSLGTFARNRRLRILDLSFNQIESIVPPIRDISLAIEYLYLNSNQLEKLDMSAFASLASLSMIDLRSNNLARVVADRTITWSGMEMLDVSYNRLRTIDLQWLVAPNLKRLILSKNLFERIPDRLRRFPNLQLLVMSENNFTGGIDLAPLNGLPELNSVDFSNNPTARFLRSSRPLRLPVLDSLYVEYCSLSRFNTSSIDLPVVSFVSLSHNKFSTVPPLAQAFPSIVSFSLINNPLPCSALRLRSELILSGKLILGPPQTASACPDGSIQINSQYLFCCKA